ncbi:hypothetical protein MMC29_000411 [Sticta canariensis]|nr:hypothetical protein [Sticta canariensis]
MSAPTFINLPPPPADPVTPSDLGPGTPNSGTTSMSALSTTAIKDGHQGHAPPHTHTRTASSGLNSSTNILDAERADRISRLAGLERVATLRGTTTHLAPGAAGAAVAAQQPQSPGYFDHAGYQQAKERSTVGSASATGSAGERTTWASGSDMCEADKMSEDQDGGASSSAGLSDEGNASLVDFGEAASSTVSGPVSRGGMKRSALFTKPTSLDEGSPMQGVEEEPSTMSPNMETNDTMSRSATAGMTDVSMTGQAHAENIVRQRLDDGERAGGRALESSEEGQGLGRFYFEGK